MITFALQLKTQPGVSCIRQFLLLFLACAAGCQDSGKLPREASNQQGAVIASLGSASETDVVLDGERLGGIVPGDILDSTFADHIQNADSLDQPSVNLPSPPPNPGNPGLQPELEDVIRRIQLLRGSDIDGTGAVKLEVRRRRNFRIIELATRSLPLAMSVANDESAFLQLVRFLLEARLELAVSGHADDIQSLYADVKALSARDPDSSATAEGVFTLARFAHEMARRRGGKEPEWFDNFAQWAGEFARRFPQQKKRATVLLLGSARSCELQSLDTRDPGQSAMLMKLARRNYLRLISDFENSDEAVEATAVLRRLDLPGQQLSQFSGQTLDSDRIDSQAFVDAVTVIYFWDDRDSEFSEQLLPLLQQAAEVANGQLRFVGVPLNDDVTSIRDFLQRHHVPGKQIVGSTNGHRGWNHPLVRFWGLSRGATCWLIDRNRTVAAVDVTSADLVDRMRVLFPREEAD